MNNKTILITGTSAGIGLQSSIVLAKLGAEVVMVGRDIGTVVLPEADLKIYLDASAEERAKRRFDEMVARGAKVDYDNILARVIERDRIDSTRDVAPLKAADDAIVVDSDKLNIDQVFKLVLNYC